MYGKTDNQPLSKDRHIEPVPSPDSVQIQELADVDGLLSHMGNVSELFGGTVSVFLAGQDRPTPLADGRPIFHRGSPTCSGSDEDAIRRHWECISHSGGSGTCLCGSDVLCYTIDLEYDGVRYPKALVCFSVCPRPIPSAEKLKSVAGIPEDAARRVTEYLEQVETQADRLRTVEKALSVGLSRQSEQLSVAYASLCANAERSRAERTLNEESEWFRQVTNNVPDVMWTMDLDYRIHSVSQSILEVTGYTAEEAIGQNLSKFLTPDAFESTRRGVAETLTRDAMGTHISNPTGMGVSEHIRKDGTIFLGESRSSFMRDLDGKIVGLVGVTRDVTERVRIETALREAEEKYRLLVEESLVGVYIVQDDKYVYVNPRLAEMFGYEPEEIVNRLNVLDLAIPEERGKVHENLRKRFSGETKSSHYTVKCLRKDGGVIDLEAFGTVMTFQGRPAVFGMAIDITDRVRAERALLEAEEKYRLLIEESLVGVYVIDEVGKYGYVNPQFADMLGYAPEDIVGRLSVRDLVPADTLPDVLDHMQRRFDGERPDPHYMTKVLRKDGAILDVELYVSMMSHNGRPAIFGTVIDITDRLRAEEALAVSEANYRAVFDSVRDGISVVGEDEIFLDANRSYCEMFGYDRDELIGSRLADIPRFDRDAHEDRLRILREQGDGRFEITRYALDGRVLIVDMQMRPFEHHGQSAYLSVHRDITERRKAEEALRAEHAFRQAIETSTLTGVSVVDTEGRMTYVNRAFCEMVGWSEDDLVGLMPPRPFWPPEEIDTLRQVMTRSIAGDIPPEGFEIRFMRPNGERYDVHLMPCPLVDGDGRQYGVMASTVDITDRKRAEAELSWLASFPARSPQPVLEADPSGHVCYINSVLRDLFPDLWERGPDHPWLADWDAIVSDLRYGNRKIVRDVVVGDATYEQVIIPVDDLQRIRVYGSDVSMRKQAQDELRRRADRLESQHAKLKVATEQKASFFASMSHELRTPMTSIIGFTELMFEDLEDPITPGQRELLNKVLQNSRRLLAVVNDLLDLSRLESRRVTPVIGEVDLGLVAEQVVANMRSMARDKDLRLIVTKGKCVTGVYTDEQKLSQILVNLLSNAIKFTPQGSVVVTVKATDREIEIDVSDTGVGIPRSEWRKIFEEFHTRTEPGKHKMSGTGLGLPIAKKLCELLGGRIKVASEVGHGSTFTISLPNRKS